ncbi:MAG: serine--tRNA ligase [Bacteroidota bacterium]
MLDLKFIRENIELVKGGILAKSEVDNVDEIISLDETRRKFIQEVESLKAKRNDLSQKIGEAKRIGENVDTQIEESNLIKARAQKIDEELKNVEISLSKLLLTVPNVPHPTVPIGKTPNDNKVIYEFGEKQIKESWRVPHWELTEKFGIIDFSRGAKVAGAGFPFYVGKGAILERALINFFLDEANKKGYTEIMPPIVVNEESARGTGQIPDKEDLMYIAERDGLYMIPTAEVPVSNYLRNEVIEENKLPIKFCAYTPCFRREAGSYGKDVRGLNRLHQFDKVELVKFVHPNSSYDELESLRIDAEDLLKLLGLTYRTLLMCTGDMGFTQTKKYDLEVWASGQEKWLEVSSCSNFETFQARRMQVKFKSRETNKQEYLHTLNGSGLALPRVVAAIIENYQTPEGKIIVPKVLHPYTKFTVID